MHGPGCRRLSSDIFLFGSRGMSDSINMVVIFLFLKKYRLCVHFGVGCLFALAAG